LNFITSLLDQYGYIILFTGLLLELIALPTPGEILMSYCGFLVYQNKLNWGISILVSAMGASIGITISFFIGLYLGKTFFVKYGSYIHMGPERMEKTSKWFERHGNKLLIIAYYIPGVRHITGYFSGITKIPYRKFAFNAYLGAFIWAGTFITLGKILGPKWEIFHSSIKKYLIIISLVIVAIIIVYYIYKNYKSRIINFTIQLLKNTLKTYHSLGKVKVVVACIAFSFLLLLVLVASLIQDFLANEFSQFDIIASFLVQSIFTSNWSGFMRFFMVITSPGALIILIVIIVIWIILKDENKLLEIRALFFVIIAGQLLQEGLGLVFHKIGPLTAYIIGDIKHAFPNQQAFMAVVAFGFGAYILLRHTDKAYLKPLTIIIFLSICLFTGLSGIFFQTQYPSDVSAGYAFGGVWLSLNIVLLEVFRSLQKVNNTNDVIKGI